MANDIDIIDVNSIGIKYTLYKEKRRKLKEFLLHPLMKLWGRKNEFWALRDVTFKVQRGEALGIIGKNGSGKSTLLMTLSGIMKPDQGTINIKGAVSTLLTLGAGFMPDLSGHDNIYLNGAFLGLSKKEIEEKYEEIVQFSELGEFIHVPVKNYSTGMKARLGFSIASSIKPDILLIDEVLNVGDVTFKEKSKAKMLKLMEQARAIIIVTHSMDIVSELCSRTLWLEKGKVMAIGESKKITEEYLTYHKK